MYPRGGSNRTRGRYDPGFVRWEGYFAIEAARELLESATVVATDVRHVYSDMSAAGCRFQRQHGNGLSSREIASVVVSPQRLAGKGFLMPFSPSSEPHQAPALAPKEREVVDAYLWTLSAASIPWLLLPSYGSSSPSPDREAVLFVSRRFLRQARSLLTRAVGSGGGHISLGRRHNSRVRLSFVLGSEPEKALCLDLFYGAFTWHGLPFLSDEELLGASRENASGHPVPSPAHEALFLFAGGLLRNKMISEAAMLRIAELLGNEREREEFDLSMGAAFGVPLEIPFDPAAPSSDPAEMSTAARELRRRLVSRAVQANPIGSLGRVLRYRTGLFGFSDGSGI